jgi:sialic acid synthase
MGKKLVAACDLPAGTVLTREDIALKSPRGGMQPYELENILGKKLTVALTEDGDFRFEDLETVS